MERGTEYGLEQVYNVIDSRYISKKPLIATTNLTPEQFRNPEDVPHARIYGRLLEMLCLSALRADAWKFKAAGNRNLL